MPSCARPARSLPVRTRTLLSFWEFRSSRASDFDIRYLCFVEGFDTCPELSKDSIFVLLFHRRFAYSWFISGLQDRPSRAISCRLVPPRAFQDSRTPFIHLISDIAAIADFADNPLSYKLVQLSKRLSFTQAQCLLKLFSRKGVPLHQCVQYFAPRCGPGQRGRSPLHSTQRLRPFRRSLSSRKRIV